MWKWLIIIQHTVTVRLMESNQTMTLIPSMFRSRFPNELLTLAQERADMPLQPAAPADRQQADPVREALEDSLQASSTSRRSGQGTSQWLDVKIRMFQPYNKPNAIGYFSCVLEVFQ